jgi:AraC-like DNA-binding protein
MSRTHDPDLHTDPQGSADGGTPPGFTNFISARASDPSEAEEVVTRLYLPHRLDLSAGSGDLDMQLSALTLASVTIGRLGYGRDLRLVTEEAAQFHVNTPLAGSACSRRGSSDPLVTSPREAAVFAPGESAQIDWVGRCTQLCLMISRGALEAELEHMLGRHVTTPLEFDFGMDLSTPMGRSWAETLRLVVNEMDHGPGLATHPFAFRHAERLLLDGILLGQRHNYHDALFSPSASPPPGPVARAVELIQEQPGAPWSTSSLAREVHLSVRALQEGFKRHVGRPPTSYLRDVRLRHVHDELRSAVPGSTTVSSVASRLGIVHMGRFAGAYRSAFGESPRETLARFPD